MSDIYLGIPIILLLCAGTFLLGKRLARSGSNRSATLLALGAVVAIVLYLYFLKDSLFLARILPFSNLFILGNPLPLFGAFLAGLAWVRIPGKPWRKGIVVAPLILIALYAAYGRLLGEPPICKDYWSDGVCIQTSFASCSAASAATLLKAHGLQATEAEMASLCFTRKTGTTMAGLYRGLKLKTADTTWDVEVFSCDIDELQRRGYGPAILKVGIEENDTVDPVYEKEWGWTEGVPHTVVLFNFLGNGEIEMGDPSIGRERWRLEHLETLWHGVGIRLVRR